jgi:HrpA-like RNA helicase
MNTSNLNDQLKQIEKLLPDAMHAPRHAVLREMRQLRQRKNISSNDKKLLFKINNFKKRLRVSIEQKKHRLRHRPKTAYDENLPIVDRRKDIIEAIQKQNKALAND